MAAEDYSKTLNLPQTEFPMRANLPQREGEYLKYWQDIDLYHEILKQNANKPKFILHDGPPYANGNIHLGHVLNKVLKDMICKFKSMDGYNAPYVPGWDTHGLPIEQKAIKELGINRHQVSKNEFRDKCKEFALGFVNTQREQFKRVGVRADWDNPYITLMPKYEAEQVKAFGEMCKKGYIYKGLKPVYWCMECETALAEAEIEYADHTSPSIYVKFPVKDGKGIVPEDAYFVIWTTTPWTIPANVGICLNEGFTYCLTEIAGSKLIVAKDLLEQFAKAIEAEDYQVLAEYQGKDLERIVCKHPLFDRDSLVILGDHVTLEAGTGCVHTAPGHGVDDFMVGKKYDLPVIAPVDDKGCFTEEAGPFAGLKTITDGNKAVLAALTEAGALLKTEHIRHQYPHCWRCKHPIIFRATEQWFASIDGFREKALEEIDKVKFIPAWGHDRIYNMVRDRGDWCISRQRSWGVPIPIFYCDKCGKDIINDETIKKTAELFGEYGSNIWYEKDADELVPEGFVCPECGHNHFRKEMDIMDVWFDSGSSSFGVLEQRPELDVPADLYLEGSDQHRGWFNSSLSISTAVRGYAPYRQVLTHGFLVDEKGRKMSKSLGNFVDPLETIEQMGADVLRLWVASADYRNDLAVSPGIMKQVGESYRKIRNTMRFLIGNTHDYDNNINRVAYKDLMEIDRLAEHKLQLLVEKVLEAYRNYEFHVVYHAIHKFCVVDMSASYLDIIKDRLYVECADDVKRRSAQTVMYDILQVLLRLITPILAFTSEEIYSFLPKDDNAPQSVQMLSMPRVKEEYKDDVLAAKWDTIFAVKEKVAKELEAARVAKTIGHSLDAAVTIYCDDDIYDICASLGDYLPYVLIVSQARLRKLSAKPNDITAEDGVAVSVEAAAGIKCARCWIYSETVGENENHPDLCHRCATVMEKINK